MKRYIINIAGVENKNISDEEKRKEIKMQAEDAKKRSEEDNNVKLNKKAIGLIFAIAIFWGILIGVISSTNFFLRIKKYCEEEIFSNHSYYLVRKEILLLAVFAIFVYCVYKKIKLVRQEKHWESVMKNETANLQELCESLCDDASLELKDKLNKIKIYKRISILIVTLPIVFFLLLYEDICRRVAYL